MSALSWSPTGPVRTIPDGGSRLITTTFVDVERSAELLTRLGDADGVAHIDATRERIVPYGGREVKSLGGGMMIVFEAPLDAVGFSLAVQRTCRAVSSGCASASTPLLSG